LLSSVNLITLRSSPSDNLTETLTQQESLK